MTRVSDRFRYETTNNRIQSVRSHHDEVQETAMSGRKIRRISDDPVGAVRVLRNREGLGGIGQFRKSLDFARGFMGKIEDSLLSIDESVIRAKELAVQQANATWDATARRAVSEEVRQLVDHVISLGNATYGGKYVFGGFRTFQPPIAADGTYAGDDGMMFIQVDEDSFRPVNVPGRDIFGLREEEQETGVPLVQTLRNLYDSLQGNSVEGIRKGIGELESLQSRIVDATAQLGARRAAIEDVNSRLDRREEQLLIDTNALESADPVKSALDFKRAETAVNSTLTASSKILTPSLIDFLK